MKDINGNVIPESNHRIQRETRIFMIYEMYTRHAPLYEKYYMDKNYPCVKQIASFLGQALYDATKGKANATGLWTTGAKECSLRPENASREHSFGRTEGSFVIHNETIKLGKIMTYDEFKVMIDKYYFTVYSTGDENAMFSQVLRKNRDMSWIDAYKHSDVDLYKVPTEKVSRSLVYHFDKAKKVSWDTIKKQLAY